MIEIVTPDRYLECEAGLDQMFRMRHHVFSERMKWDVKSIDGRERDEFDDLNPVYILGWGEGGRLKATWRLLPTTGPYMIESVFRDLMEGHELPSSAAVWETSRFAVDHGDNDDDNLGAISETTRELFCGLVEFGIAHGIREIITMYDIGIARLLPRVGCRPKWRTSGKRVANTIAIVGGFAINDQVLEEIRAKGEIKDTVLTAESRNLLFEAA